MKKLRYLLEAAILYSFYYFCALLPPQTSSNIGGFIGRSIGPHLAASRKARDNVRRALPGKSDEEIERIITEMWDNLGRVMAEYPHLESIARNRTTVTNESIAQDILKQANGGIFVSGHFANWEVMMPTMLARMNVTPHLTYRAANNPMADRLLAKARSLKGRVKTFPKHRSSAKDLMAAMKDKQYLGILIDQKYNEGVAVNFFGHPAMTNQIAVVLGQKYKAPIIPATLKRTGAAQFEMNIHPPLSISDEAGNALSHVQVLEAAHRIFEEFITQNPGQWLWLHRRWDSKNLKSS